MYHNSYKILFKNTASITTGRFISRIAQFFMFIYAARRLGTDQFGIFSFANNLVSMISLFMDMGISRYSIQQMSRDIKSIPVYLGANLLIKSFFVTFIYLLCVVVIMRLGSDILTINSLFILIAVAALDNITMSFSAVFDADEKMHYSAIIIIISNISMSIIGFIIILLFNNLLLFCGTITLGAFFRLALTISWYYKKYSRPVFRLNFNFSKNLIKMGIIFVLPIIFGTIYNYIDSVMLKFIDGSKSVGYYNAAYVIFEAPLFLSGTVATALFPTVSRLYAENSLELDKIISRLSNLGITFGLSIASSVIFLSEKLITAVYGQEYIPSAHVLPVLISTIIFIIPSEICTTAIRAADRQTVCVFVSGCGAIANILLNIVLIPRYSFLGAAYSTLITEIIVTAIYIEITRRYIVKSIFRIEYIIKSIFLSGILLLFLHLTNSFEIWLQITGCAVLFIPLCLAIGLFSIQEIRSILVSH